MIIWETAFRNVNFKSVSVVVYVHLTMQNLVNLRGCFTEDGKEMYQEL